MELQNIFNAFMITVAILLILSFINYQITGNDLNIVDNSTKEQFDKMQNTSTEMVEKIKDIQNNPISSLFSLAPYVLLYILPTVIQLILTIPVLILNWAFSFIGIYLPGEITSILITTFISIIFIGVIFWFLRRS